MKIKTQTKLKSEKLRQKQDKLDRILSFAILAVLIVFMLSFIPYFLPTGEKIVVAQQISSEAFDALLSGGIGSSNTVDIGDPLKVFCQLPEKVQKGNADMYILGVLSVLAPNREKIMIAAYSGETKIGAIEVQMSDILRYRSKEIDLEEFKSRFVAV